MKKEIEDLKEVIAIQEENLNNDPYMYACYNGLVTALSIITGEEPKFKRAPNQEKSLCKSCFNNICIADLNTDPKNEKVIECAWYNKKRSYQLEGVKPIRSKVTGQWICPICKSYLEVRHKYCMYHGKLDWSKEEEV